LHFELRGEETMGECNLRCFMLCFLSFFPLRCLWIHDLIGISALSFLQPFEVLKKTILAEIPSTVYTESQSDLMQFQKGYVNWWLRQLCGETNELLLVYSVSFSL
jgi:hypothetical protein